VEGGFHDIRGAHDDHETISMELHRLELVAEKAAFVITGVLDHLPGRLADHDARSLPNHVGHGNAPMMLRGKQYICTLSLGRMQADRHVGAYPKT
jgi:hypothetical protein